MKQLFLILTLIGLTACGKKGGGPQPAAATPPYKSYVTADGTFRVSWGTQTFNENAKDFTIQVDQGSLKFLCFMNNNGASYSINTCDEPFTQAGTYTLTESELVLCQGSSCQLLSRDYSWTKE